MAESFGKVGTVVDTECVNDRTSALDAGAAAVLWPNTVTETLESRAYQEGSVFGYRFAQRAPQVQDEWGAEFRSQVVTIKKFRSKHSCDQWQKWDGRLFPFDTAGLQCALSVVLVAFPLLRNFVTIRDSNAAESVCRVIWGPWLAGAEPGRIADATEMALLKHSGFVKGFVDAVASANLDEPNAVGN